MAETAINYDGRKFIPTSNSATGEVSGDTIFHYHQDGKVFWAEYAGGAVCKGFMVGMVQPDGGLVLSYQHLNTDDTIRSGRCVSVPELLHDGRLRLHEKWQWNDSSKEEGHSIVEEII